MCVAELVAILLGWLLTTFTDLSTVDHDVEVVGEAVDADRTEEERLKSACGPLCRGLRDPQCFCGLAQIGRFDPEHPAVAAGAGAEQLHRGDIDFSFG